MQMSQIKGTSLPQLFKLQNGHKKIALQIFLLLVAIKRQSLSNPLHNG